jgi:hypothetical protein
MRARHVAGGPMGDRLKSTARLQCSLMQQISTIGGWLQSPLFWPQALRRKGQGATATHCSIHFRGVGASAVIEACVGESKENAVLHLSSLFPHKLAEMLRRRRRRASPGPPPGHAAPPPATLSPRPPPPAQRLPGPAGAPCLRPALLPRQGGEGGAAGGQPHAAEGLRLPVLRHPVLPPTPWRRR